ncbi:MAG: hypothetical protein AABW82_01960 [Nanoarchaeota archaeon]
MQQEKHKENLINKTMENYSHPLYYLEDSLPMRAAITDQLRRQGINNIAQGGNLSDLEKYLAEGKIAQAYLFDGNFPEKLGGRVELNAFLAVDRVRTLDRNAKIAILSSDDSLKSSVEGIGIKFFHKRTIEPKDIADWLKQS